MRDGGGGGSGGGGGHSQGTKARKQHTHTPTHTDTQAQAERASLKYTENMKRKSSDECAPTHTRAQICTRTSATTQHERSKKPD